jgi:hypothetical protein
MTNISKPDQWMRGVGVGRVAMVKQGHEAELVFNTPEADVVRWFCLVLVKLDLANKVWARQMPYGAKHRWILTVD